MNAFNLSFVEEQLTKDIGTKSTRTCCRRPSRGPLVTVTATRPFACRGKARELHERVVSHQSP